MFVKFRLQQTKNENTMETPYLKCSGPLLVFTVFVPMFTYKVVFDFLLHFANFIALKKEKDSVPRVRIELTTFRYLLQIMRLTRCLLR